MSAECEKCGGDLTYGNWPVGECPRCEAEARVRELEAEVERLRSPYRAFTAERRVAELVAERDELRADAQTVVEVAEHLRPHWDNGSVGASEMNARIDRLKRDALHSPVGPSTDEDKP